MRTKSRLWATCCLALCVGSGSALPTASAGVRPAQSVETTLASVRLYLSEYRATLSVVIAEEQSSQRINRQVPQEPNTPRRRVTTGAVHFRFIEDERVWRAIRDVKAVDGQPVPEESGLSAALRELDTGLVAQTFKAFNTKYNIGRVVRTFSEPTLPLDILESNRAGQFAFKHEGSKTVDGVVLVTLSFRENPNTTPFILDPRMRQADVRGEFVVEADTGRIRKTTLNVKMNDVRAALVTTYARDESLGMWVPVAFTESYVDGFENTGNVAANISLQYEAISCESTYFNFRRVPATSSIK